MKRSLGLSLGLFVLMGSISSTQGISIKSADVQFGVAVVEGRASTNATIFWEGNPVTNANGKNGGFKVFGFVPADCVGTLSDGVATIDVPLAPCVVVAAASVPQTGQLASYDSNTPQSDDGAVQAGVPSPNPRFADNLNGTITDNLTGLIWLKNAGCHTLFTDWQTALNDVVELNTTGMMTGNNCGDTSNGGTSQTDWRLPNVRELLSLFDYGVNPSPAPALPTDHPFINFPSSIFWSSTTFANNTTVAWWVSSADGSVSRSFKTGTQLRVLPVRAGL